jgi:hypothetical protein
VSGTCIWPQPPAVAVTSGHAGKSVAESLTAAAPSAVVKCLSLDTADSSSIQELAAVVQQEYDQQIDLLVSRW